jgi:hypothetical protein
VQNKEKGEKKMNKLSKVSSYALIAMLLLGICFVAAPVKAVPNAMISLVNAADGTNLLEFTTAQKSYGDNIVINVTGSNFVSVTTWQVHITWDASLLDFVSFTFPSDSIFAYDSPIPAVSTGPGDCVAGQALGSGATPPSFTGDGRLAQLTLKIIQAVGILPPTSVTCPLHLVPGGSDTYVLQGLFTIVPDTTDATYHYYWVQPTTIPRLYMVPSTIKPANPGAPFTVSIYVDNVDAGWEITVFQFSIAWNTSLMQPVAPFFTNGTFFETFQYASGGVLYATDFNEHNRPPPLTPLPADYNYSTVGELLMPDFASPYNGTYHAPYPHTSPGLLGTFYFQADPTFSTIAPAEFWSSISFIPEDVLVLNHYNMDIGYSSLTNAQYRAPQKVLGLSIDLYTQYPYPYGGQGGNMTSDSFGPQQQVELFALVTYNEFPVQQKLVGFEIFHHPTNGNPDYIFTREGTTDSVGIAHVSFRLPWPCADPVGDIFGWWYVNATVEVAEQVVVDQLRFWVWWPVQVISIEPKFTTITQNKYQGSEDAMNFTMQIITYHLEPQDLLLTGTVYDELGFYIGGAWRGVTLGWLPPVMPVYPPDMAPGDPTPGTDSWDFSVPLITNAVVGKGIIYGNAFNNWPWYGGVPYCPEVSNTIDFYIAKP